MSGWTRYALALEQKGPATAPVKVRNRDLVPSADCWTERSVGPTVGGG